MRIDRAKAAELDISIADIGRTLQLAFGETRFGYFVMEGRQYQVIGQVARADRNEPNDLRRLHVRSRSGRLVPLDNLVTLEETVGPPAIYRFNRFIAATVSGGSPRRPDTRSARRSPRSTRSPPPSCPRASPPISPASRATSSTARAACSSRSSSPSC